MKTGKILVVDDDESIVYAFTRVLRSAGYETVEAASGEAALDVARAEAPDLVLLDTMLPGMSGLDVCRTIKSDEAYAGTFVIMVSGTRTSGEDIEEGVDSGADGYLTKPIGNRALLANVRALLRIKHSEDALRESNRRLEEYNRLKAEFVANMSHELRTPLNAIIGFAQLMKLNRVGEPLGQAQRDAVERILRNGRHLLTLIDGVLDLSKIEAGRMTLHPEYFDLVEVVQGSFGELQSLAKQKGLEFRLAVDESLPIAYTDPVRVRQVIANLISNALKFTVEGSVDVRLERASEEEWRLTVADTGIGIKPEHIGLIFERFRQVDGSTTRREGGAGLGLTIVREIVEQLGGHVDVSSTSDVGSTFTVVAPFHLPADLAAEVDRDAAYEGALHGAAHGSGEKPLVLVVEDDPDARTLLAATLADAGYRVETAADGRHGLRLARELQPAAITLDVMMPSVDGWRVLQQLKESRETAEIPVIICSIVDNRPLGYKLGVSDYLLKPVTPDVLVRALENVGASPSDSGEYLLVVDDEPAIRDLLTTSLQHTGYAVRSAPSGEVAIKMAARHTPRVVFCDLMMPGGMSGFELIARLRAEPKTAATPIIVVTGKDMNPDDRRLLSGQIAEVVRKGDLLLPDLEAHLRETLSEIGVFPRDGSDTSH